MAIRLNIFKQFQSNFIMIFSILFGLLLVFLIDGWQPYLTLDSEEFPDGKIPPRVRHGELTAEERNWAITAWKYFEHNYNHETGLVNSTDKFPITTMWDTSSYLLALVSAYKLDIINEKIFHLRLTKALRSLKKLPLFQNKLPNKAYNVQTLMMVDYNDPWVENHIGWSVLDISRLMVPLYYLAWSFPEYADLIKEILKRWKLDLLVSKGEIIGAHYNDGKLELTQEGRLGYEEYAAKSLALYGLDVVKSSQYDANLKFKKIEGVYVATDSRDPKTHKAQNYIVSEPYILDGIEFGWDSYSKNLSYRVYKAQLERFKNTGIYTAVSEDHIDQSPHFIYNAVYARGKAWQTLTELGEDASNFRSISTKAAIGWYVLYEEDYTSKLIQQIMKSKDPNNGWFAGIYEKDNKVNSMLTTNTNGIILESLCFKVYGPFIKINNF